MLSLTHQKTKEGVMLGNEMIGERKLWATVVLQGINELRSESDVEVLKAALYFFTEGDGKDHIGTFDGVCRAYNNNIDPERAARRIWRKLKYNQKERIKKLIRESGYESLVH